MDPRYTNCVTSCLYTNDDLVPRLLSTCKCVAAMLMHPLIVVENKIKHHLQSTTC